MWCKGSGCVGSVAFGLYGSGTLLWGMSTKARISGMFWRFWDVMTCIINALIFFYVGASCVNFTIRWVGGWVGARVPRAPSLALRLLLPRLLCARYSATASLTPLPVNRLPRAWPW